MFSLLINNFSVNDLLNIPMLILTIILSLFYLWITGSPTHTYQVSPFKKLFFLTGIFSFYLGFSGPLYLLGHLFFTAHMVQMAVCYLITPPLLIMGLPTQFLHFLITFKPTKKILALSNYVLISLILFNALFSFYHFPLVLDFMMVNYLPHKLFQAVLFVAAILMWWPVLNPLATYTQLSYLKKIAYVFGSGVLLTPACALLIFSNATLFATYTDPVIWSKALSFCIDVSTPIPIELFQSFSPMSPLNDQQLGGVVMKLIQEFVYGITITYLVFKWIKKEKIYTVDPI